jgi:hypothetical protein
MSQVIFGVTELTVGPEEQHSVDVSLFLDTMGYVAVLPPSLSAVKLLSMLFST